jgi:hypothetical protein
VLITASAIENIADRMPGIISRLTSVSVRGDDLRLTLPIIYPSGSEAVVQITASGSNCLVSDLGVGSHEANLGGFDDLYPRYARLVGDALGVRFDGHGLFVLDAPVDRLDGAIVNVANASVRAVSLAGLNASERREKARNEELFEKLITIFPLSVVRRNTNVVGASRAWQAHNVVELPSRQKTIYEFVGPSATSVYSKATMFLDISVLEEAPTRVSVVNSLEGMGEFVGVLSHVSNVIQLEASREVYEKYANAA